MDASNEAPFGVGLDEFIEFTKDGVRWWDGGGSFSFCVNSFTQTKVGGRAQQIEEFGGMIFICSLAASVHK